MTRSILAIILALSALAAGPALAAEELKIGALFPLTGPLSLDGRNMLQAVEILTEMQNERGGINGRKIKLAIGDAVDVKTGRSEAERLINVEGVKLIVGTYASAISYAATEVAERHSVFYWEANAVADAITERGFKYTFRPSIKGSNVGAVGAKFIKEVLAPKFGIAPEKLRLAIVHEDSIFGTTGGDAFAKYSKEAGLNVVETAKYVRTSTDLSSVVLRVKAAQPDVIFMTSYIPDGSLFIKQAKQLGLRPKAIFTYGVFNDPPALEALGADIENLFCISWPAGGINMAVLSKQDQADVNEFIRRYKGRHKVDRVPQFSFGAYAGTKALYDLVLPKAASLEPAALRAAALRIDLPEGGTAYGFGIKFAENGQNLKSYNVVWQWQDRDVYIVHPERLATRPPVFKPSFTR